MVAELGCSLILILTPILPKEGAQQNDTTIVPMDRHRTAPKSHIWILFLDQVERPVTILLDGISAKLRSFQAKGTKSFVLVSDTIGTAEKETLENEAECKDEYFCHLAHGPQESKPPGFHQIIT